MQVPQNDSKLKSLTPRPTQKKKKSACTLFSQLFKSHSKRKRQTIKEEKVVLTTGRKSTVIDENTLNITKYDYRANSNDITQIIGFSPDLSDHNEDEFEIDEEIEEIY